MRGCCGAVNSEYAEAFVTGMQGNQADGYLKVSACLKHYAAYSMEGVCPSPSCRESFPAVVTAVDMEGKIVILSRFACCPSR